MNPLSEGGFLRGSADLAFKQNVKGQFEHE
jgi:hypothetical protein